MATFPTMQGLAGMMLGDTSTSTTGDMCIGYNAMSAPPMQMYSTPSTERMVQQEQMRKMADRIKNLERKEKMKKVLPNHTVPRAHMETPVEFKARKMRAGWAFPPEPDKPDEFTQLYNHDFHKLLANFDALLEN